MPEDLEVIEPRFVCLDCRREIDPDAERCFMITDELVLCHECALRRGGAFDEESDAWARAPRLEDVPGPASPW